MGLLDDAIRDHLELKRRRGADPGEIAREEREALEPIFPDEPRPAVLDGEPQAAPVLDEEPPQGDPLTAAAAEASAPVASIGEETAELDMEAVLAQDERLAAEAQVPHPAPGVQPGATVEDELLEWEDPAAAEPPPEPIPGQERLSFE